MAVTQTTIEAVRVTSATGTETEFEWDPMVWYLVRDDQPFLDILVRGYAPQAHQKKAFETLETLADGRSWHRWSFEHHIARRRQLGELTLALKVPSSVRLQVYVIPAKLVTLSDVLHMVEEVEGETDTSVAWDSNLDSDSRAWSTHSPRALQTAELLAKVTEELNVAGDLRRHPFDELGPRARRGMALPENAVVSHWAAVRRAHLEDVREGIESEIANVDELLKHYRSPQRQEALQGAMGAWTKTLAKLEQTSTRVASMVTHAELTTPIVAGPSLQRDHRLRRLLRAFAPPVSERLSAEQSALSDYPPVTLNDLWELWGAVWLAGSLRRAGFDGSCVVHTSQPIPSCSWKLRRDAILIELDFEPEPMLVDHALMPPAHERAEPALEWAARHQAPPPERPFLGLEEKCTPDYLLRITTESERALIVGDACLASPEHHGGKQNPKRNTKPHTVEKYRQTIGWLAPDHALVRCHPMGGFVLFPPPSSAWSEFETLEYARDATLISPAPQGPGGEAEARFWNLVEAVCPSVSREIQRSGHRILAAGA